MSSLSDPKERAALKAMIVEITHSLSRQDAEKEQIKDILEAAEDRFAIKKKYIRKMAGTMHKSNYADLQQETEHFELLYESVCETPVNNS